MAPKRSAQPPPPPPPPADSSEETASGSGSEESESEEEIAHSLPPAAPKNTAPLPLKGQESEGSDEEEEEEEGEEEEEEEEEGEEEEEEEGEEEEEETETEKEKEKLNHVAPPATKSPSPPPPPNREEPETSGDDEEEETDDEAPQPKPKPAPIQEAEGKGAKPSSGEDKKPAAPFQRIWSTDDEVRILEALAAYRRQHGTLPQADALADALAGRLDNSSCSLAVLQSKITTLKRRYSIACKKGELPSKDHDRLIFDLAKSVWGPVAAKAVAAANGGARREFDEMCKLYPYLAEEVKELQRAHKGLFKREFAMMDDDKARSLDAKIKRQRMYQLRLHNRRHDLTKEVTKTLIDLVD